jgi:hypothetical protein
MTDSSYFIFVQKKEQTMNSSKHKMTLFLQNSKRMFTALRGVLLSSLDMLSVLECCGTAGRTVRMRAAPELAYLPEFAPGG